MPDSLPVGDELGAEGFAERLAREGVSTGDVADFVQPEDAAAHTPAFDPALIAPIIELIVNKPYDALAAKTGDSAWKLTPLEKSTLASAATNAAVYTLEKLHLENLAQTPYGALAIAAVVITAPKLMAYKQHLAAKERAAKIAAAQAQEPITDQHTSTEPSGAMDEFEDESSFADHPGAASLIGQSGAQSSVLV